MPVKPCRRCGGRGEFTCRANPNKPHQIPCPRCEGMPKLAKPWTLMNLALQGQDWFFPDPDTVMRWCDYHLSRFLNGDTCVMAEQIYEFGLCDFGWVARPVRLETVEEGKDG